MTEIAATRRTEFVSEAREALNQAIDNLGGDLALDPDPIYEKWILSGKPVARSKTLVLTPDGASKTVLWDCTSGTFCWYYRQDEAVLFISGDAYLLEENGQERRFAAGDFAFFPAGTVANWRVDSYVRKIAFLHEPMWRLAVPLLTFWNNVIRRLGFSPKNEWTRISLRG
jgi:uncharacterized protein